MIAAITKLKYVSDYNDHNNKKIKLNKKNDVKKMLKKCDYYFENEAVKTAFEECYQAIFDELTTGQAINLNECINIINEAHSDDEYKNDEILINASNIRENVEILLNEYHIDERALFLSDKQIQERLEEILIRLRDDENDKRHDFSIILDKKNKSQYNTLFNVLNAREIENSEEILEYSDFEYSNFFDAINAILSQNDQLKEFEFDHVGGDSTNDFDYLDIYYNFKI